MIRKFSPFRFIGLLIGLGIVSSIVAQFALLRFGLDLGRAIPAIIPIIFAVGIEGNRMCQGVRDITHKEIWRAATLMAVTTGATFLVMSLVVAVLQVGPEVLSQPAVIGTAFGISGALALFALAIGFFVTRAMAQANAKKRT